MNVGVTRQCGLADFEPWFFTALFRRIEKRDQGGCLGLNWARFVVVTAPFKSLRRRV